MKTLCQEEHPEKRTFCWGEGFSFLPEGKRADAVSKTDGKIDKTK